MDNERFTMWQGDCLGLMRDIPDKSVDAIICDLPYGTTACVWDSVIPFDKLWEAYKRVIKPKAAIVLFGSQPFTTDLINSNRKWFKYTLVWEKDNASNFVNAKRRFLSYHEDITIFYKEQPKYNPQKVFVGARPNIGGKNSRGKIEIASVYGEMSCIVRGNYEATKYRYPKSVLKFNTPKHNSPEGKHHPTQKPLALLEYLIKTYSNENDLILDNTMGSGTTAVACFNTNRRFIGIEKDTNYFDIACNRLDAAQKQLELFVDKAG